MGDPFLAPQFVRSEMSDVILDELSHLRAAHEDLVDGDMDCKCALLVTYLT